MVHEVEAARESLRETLDGYRGAEAAKATDVTRVLTLFAALFLTITFHHRFLRDELSQSAILVGRMGMAPCHRLDVAHHGPFDSGLHIQGMDGSAHETQVR